MLAARPKASREGTVASPKESCFLAYDHWHCLSAARHIASDHHCLFFMFIFILWLHELKYLPRLNLYIEVYYIVHPRLKIRNLDGIFMLGKISQMRLACLLRTATHVHPLFLLICTYSRWNNLNHPSQLPSY